MANAEKAASGITSNEELDLMSRPEPASQKLDVLGWRRTVIIMSAFLGCFLSFLDVTIVAVALPTISDHFGSYDKSAWVFTAYMLTYMAFGIILPRLSDVFGLLTIEILSLVIFLTFSIGCALSRTMMRLIIFRAMEGIGGSGLYSMTSVIILNIVRREEITFYAACISGTQAVAVVLGPVLGGAITHTQSGSTWRWIFFLNIPICTTAVVALLVAWPRERRKSSVSIARLATIDVFGSALLLAFAVLLIFALQQAGARIYRWNSAATVCSLVIAGCSFVAFIAWEHLIVRRTQWRVRAVFPVNILAHRATGANILVTLLNGFVWYIALVNMPSRFQIVNGDPPMKAGLRILPLMVACAAGTFFAGGLSKKRDLTAITTIAATALQIIGYGLMTTIGDSDRFETKIYGFQVLLGFGFGMSIAGTTLMVIFQYADQPEHTAVLQGCITQMRTLGGSIGLAVGTIVLNQRLSSSAPLASALSASQLEQLYKSPLVVATLPVQDRGIVQGVFARAFTQQMYVALYVAAAGLVVSLLILQKRQAPVTKAEVQDPSRSADQHMESSRDKV